VSREPSEKPKGVDCCGGKKRKGVKTLLVMIMAVSAFLILAIPANYHSMDYTRAWGENRRNPSPQSELNLEQARKRKAAKEASVQLFFFAIFSASGIAVIKLSRGGSKSN
jgi:hypothetical protein